MQNRLALRMCSTAGRGAAKNRTFSGVISEPPVSSPSRTAPASTGTTLSAISAAGTSLSALAEEVMVKVVFLLGFGAEIDVRSTQN
jgi:hypothetical protein